ncbi:OLC1v1038064C1 [Oldenlandia corymbosa var. corymbosa]|uniref:non-specific serine/threonine protein kinase n=1 Tax=Oldenlandia corymbosa var. corymbosa TaxID=529605 RepID=A0AAV1D223_OLDCO|nr:OLC1v1038064C1 [Oldenlandia corymbosa var. corymbosa]
MAIDNCVQTTLEVVESIHGQPGWQSSLLKDVEVPLRFLRTFFMCGKKWGRGERCESFLLRIEQTLHKHVQEFQSTGALRFDDHLQKRVSEFHVCIQQSFLREMEDLYRTFLPGLSYQAGPSSPSQEIKFLGEEDVKFKEIQFLMDIMDSLLHNLQDLRHHNDSGSDSTAPVEDLEGYIRFLKNLVLFAMSLGLDGHMQMEVLLTHVQDLVLNAARLTFMCWYSHYRRMWYIVHQLTERIKPIKSKVHSIYVGVLQEASKFSLSSTHHQNLGSHKLRLGDFVGSLLFLLSQLLFLGSSHGDIFNHQMQKLFQELTFLRTVLREHISEEMPDLIVAVICEAGILIFHLFTRENEGALVENFVDLEEKFKLIKAEEDAQKHSPTSASRYPRTNKLNLLRSVMGKVKSFFALAEDFTSSSETNPIPASLPVLEKELSSRSGVSSENLSMDDHNLRISSVKGSLNSLPAAPKSGDQILQSRNLKCFSFSDLKKATRNFRRDTKLGEGRFGGVFKGWIDENSLTATKSRTGIHVAVKKIDLEDSEGSREWLAEVNYLGQLCHPHLIKLIGYCLEGEHRLLVYDYMPRGSLENHLFRRSNLQPLPWNLRLKVALGAAKGLAFLHSAETNVIHRDFKTSNILLDSGFNAKISGFGVAKDGPTDDESHVSTRVIGTYGYIAPEYVATGHLSSRSDVYGFGVVLLEMLSGRRTIDRSRSSEETSLVEWAKQYVTNKHKIFRILDNRLEGQYSPRAAYQVANLASRCTSMDPRSRPTMDEIVKELDDIQSYDNNAGKDVIMIPDDAPRIEFSDAYALVSNSVICYLDQGTEDEMLQSPNLKRFSFPELKMAIPNFPHDNVLGEGHFRSWTDENSFAAANSGTGKAIALKSLITKVFRAIGNGWVQSSNFQPLTWSLRLKIALGAAKGLAFLHSAETKINSVIDWTIYINHPKFALFNDLQSYDAKLSDFGFTKGDPAGDESANFAKAMFPSTAPESIATGHITSRTDVNSFGVVLLEMLSGRRAFDRNRPSGERCLV